MQSVISQDHREKIEYIVIDGVSTDSTVTILNDNKKHIDQLLIEADKGIYDAMNKGLNLAQGEYVLFLNAGDYLNESNLISEIESQQDIDIFYSDTLLINPQGEKLGLRSQLTTRSLPKTLNKNSFRQGLVTSHQSFIPKKSISTAYIANNLSADIDWIINCVSRSNKAFRLSAPISCFLIGGVSDQRKIRSLLDRFKVMVTHFGYIQTLFIHIGFVTRFLRKKPTYR